jgi:hypothetical protein
MAASGAVATGKAPVNHTKMPAALQHPKKVRGGEQAPRIKPLGSSTRDYGKAPPAPPMDMPPSPFPPEY